MAEDQLTAVVSVGKNTTPNLSVPALSSAFTTLVARRLLWLTPLRCPHRIKRGKRVEYQ